MKQSTKDNIVFPLIITFWGAAIIALGLLARDWVLRLTGVLK